MFEELNAHRAAVAENIQKAAEIGFTGGELEKAHKVGDIHPNGKWVWTQLPSGKYDWRVIKKTGAGSGAGSSSTAQKTAKKEDELRGFVNILKQTPNERHLEQMSVDELKRFRDSANKCWLDDENLNRSTRLRCKEWRDLAKKEIADKSEEERSATKNSDSKRQASAGKKDTNDAAKKKEKKAKVPSGHRIYYEDDLVEVYDDKGKKVYSGLFDYCDYKDEDYKWNSTDKNYDLPHGYKLVGKTKH